MNKIAKMIDGERRQKIKRTGRNSTPTNTLTKSIIDYIVATGGHAERVNNIPRPYQDKFGRTRFARLTTLRGTADIHAIKMKRNELIESKDCNCGTWNTSLKIGVPVMIEIKVGRDKQSDAQIEYQRRIEKAGGVYLIAKSFDTFKHQYDAI